MTTQDHATIDLVGYDAEQEIVRLIMVEHRAWGDRGLLLRDVQAKLNTYLSYVTTSQLANDYPQVAKKPVRIELHCYESPGEREAEFFDIVVRRHLAPAGISFQWQLID